MGTYDGCFFDDGILCNRTATELEDFGTCIGEDHKDKTDIIFIQILNK